MYPCKPKSFGPKRQWLAISTDDPLAVVKALDLREAFECCWYKGLNDAHQYFGVFVTRSINGWVLVVLSHMSAMSVSAEPQGLAGLVKDLSKQFGEAQYFSTNRVADAHGWYRARQGEMDRQYWCDNTGTLCNQGKRTDAEKCLGLAGKKSYEACEGDVLALAGEWSVNPMSIESLNLDDKPGYLGTFAPYVELFREIHGDAPPGCRKGPKRRGRKVG